MNDLSPFHLAIPVNDLGISRKFYCRTMVLKKTAMVKTGERRTMFFYAPPNNALEFKAFENNDQLFAK